MRLQSNEPDSKQHANMGDDFLKKIRPAGAVFILVLSAVGIILAFTINLSLPKQYESMHDTAYYMQNSETMLELLDELRQFVFPALEGVTDSYIAPSSDRIVIQMDRAYLERNRSIITKSFDELLFEFIE